MKMDQTSVILDKHTNLLTLEEHIYHLNDVEKPNVFRSLFPYDEVPKIAFNNRVVPHNTPEELYITDTTFRRSEERRVGKECM